MDELFDLLDRSSPLNKLENYNVIDNVIEGDSSSEEEGEIKEPYEIKDLDLADLDNSFESNEFESNIALIDDFLSTHGEMKTDFNNFDNTIFDNLELGGGGVSELNDVDLNDIDASRCLVKSEPEVALLDGNKREEETIRNSYLMRPARKVIASDTSDTEEQEDEEEDEDSESMIEEIDLPASGGGSILDSILASGRNKTRSYVETTKKGRIVDKDAELEYLLPTDLEEKLSRIVISSNTALEEVGTFVQRIEGTQTITVKAARSDPILNLNTIVLGKDKRMIGMIDNIFGIKKEPMYLVVCKNQAIASSFQGGEKLFCAPYVENAYFTAVDTPDNHCDLDSDVAFSDDEQEEKFKREMLGHHPDPVNKKKKVNRKRKTGPNQFQKRSSYQPNNNNYQNSKYGGGQKNPFRTVNTQPFINQSPLPYWQAPNMSSNPMMMTIPPPIPANPAFMGNHQYSFTNFPPPMMNINQCNSYQQFQQFQQFHPTNKR